MTPRHVNRRALFIFIIVLSLVLSAFGFVVSNMQRDYVREEARAQLAMEMALLGELAVDPLLRSDYAATERLVKAWVQRHAYPMNITAVMPNGFVLAAVRNGETTAAPLEVEQPVLFNGRKLMNLRVIADVSAREQGIATIARNAALIAAGAVVLMGWVLWGVLQRTAIQPLEREIETRTRHEQELQRRGAELEAAVEELEAFSYSVSHDLRTPLRAIDGYCHMLNEDYGKVLDDAARGHIAKARAAAQRMGVLIDDLLALARVARHELHSGEVDLGALAASVIEQLSHIEPSRQVEVTVGENLRAWADPELMRVVVENLLSNAWKYTVRANPARIEVGVQQQEGQTVFYVRDNGTGFDMRFADKLFRPFQRLHGGDYPGNGIGLATVQRIIQRHGGRVWADARPERGATFYFTLP